MSNQAWTTALVLAGVLMGLTRRGGPRSVPVLAGVIVLLVLGIVEADAAFSGFSNPAPLTVAALYVVAGAVQRTGILRPIVGRVFGDDGFVRRPLLRLLGPAIGASAFLNNTPIVAMLAPPVIQWAEQKRRSPSKFLMPLSFATILGGLLTVIGTSTNLVVSGLLADAGLGELGFFEIGQIGLPIAVVGGLLMVALAPRVLPSRRSVSDELTLDARRYSIEMIVVHGGPLDGRTVEQAGLRRLRGVFLASIDRGDTVIAPARPDTVLRGGNHLRFYGRAQDVVDLSDVAGLSSAEEHHLFELREPTVRYFEVVIGADSPLVGDTLRSVGFRSMYQAAVIALHRAGQLVDARLGTVPLKVGDTLIVVADPDFELRWRDRRDFLLVAALDAQPPSDRRRALPTVLVLVAVIVPPTLGWMSILETSLLGAIAIVALRMLSSGEARRSIDLDVIGVIAGSFGLAAAAESSGLAAEIAGGLVDLFDRWGDRGVLLGVLIATVFLTELITNNAAAALMFPIALSAATAAQLDPRGLIIGIAVAASASFLTPIGYQTNTMVYGPGGYRFGDYARLGAPLTLLVIGMTVWLVPMFWPL